MSRLYTIDYDRATGAMAAQMADGLIIGRGSYFSCETQAQATLAHIAAARQHMADLVEAELAAATVIETASHVNGSLRSYSDLAVQAARTALTNLDTRTFTQGLALSKLERELTSRALLPAFDPTPDWYWQRPQRQFRAVMRAAARRRYR